MIEVKYDHLHLRSRDVAGAVAFYADQFSAEVIGRHPDGRVDMVLGGQKLLISPGNDSPPNGESGSRPFDHFALAVTDLQAALVQLRGAGIVVVRDFRVVRPGISVAFIEGPDKALIELVQRD